MLEDADPLLPREAQEATSIVPRVSIGAFSFGDHSDGLQIRKLVERDRLREREEQLSGGQDLHRHDGFLGESGDGRFEEVRVLAELIRGGGGGGLGGVDAEGAVVASGEELGVVGFDGVDPGGAVGEELKGIVSIVNHCLFSLVVNFDGEDCYLGITMVFKSN